MIAAMGLRRAAVGLPVRDGLADLVRGSQYDGYTGRAQDRSTRRLLNICAAVTALYAVQRAEARRPLGRRRQISRP